MIKSLLIANRGEIACRIMRTANAMGIRTVAVYSDADARAKHVREADEAVWIGASPASESYLRGDVIIEAAKKAGAEAIHPGYGFLSENAAFARAVVDAGLIWVGPKADTIEAMGLKDRAKAIAEEAGVPVLPGYRGEAQDAKTLTKEAERIGYPLLIKAVAGGGGRGIRLVSEASELASELESAVREAEAAFSDGRVMLEKLVEQPCHIEVQVFGDAHGNAVHLFERDCSLQRKRQKVIEEAPAPNMPEDVRAAMCDASVKLAKAVGYEGAGTVEFIVDGSRPLALDSFWFLEMNTRLQVEHPVTEMVTGTDLVEWQLRVASGEALPVKQDEIVLLGHAIEARICAEDPSEDFRPGAGLIEEFGMLGDETEDWLRWEAG
ncbi:MAG: biotin carboxylase N-terminal domain-containing protein, partial [Pseudomonadota bacterium]